MRGLSRAPQGFAHREISGASGKPAYTFHSEPPGAQADGGFD